MKIQVTLLLSLLVILRFPSTNADGNSSLIDTSLQRIVNGTPAKTGQYPFIAKIFWYFRKKNMETVAVTCSATAIDINFVITSAQCYQLIIDDKKKRDNTKLEVELSEIYGHTVIDLRGNAGVRIGFTQQRKGVKLFVHRDFLHVSTMFDVNIALVRVNHPWDMEVPNIVPALALPIKKDAFLPCTGIGIGRSSINDERKKVASFKVKVGGVKYCRYLQLQYNKRVVHFDKFYLCAKAVNPRQDICKGDIGGALICEGLLAGVLSQRVEDHECQVGKKQFTLYISVGSPEVWNWTKEYISHLQRPQEIVMPDLWDDSDFADPVVH